jgi:hypothetical protein
MWVPREAEELEAAVTSGDLEETPSFDGKRELPPSGRNIDIAVDVAAMSTEGGSLIYGIDEDEDARLTVLAPIPLSGVGERISNVVATSISEVPFIKVEEHPLSTDPTRGYVAVLIPQSARAPHQVTVKDDRRFYGRAAKGNRRLGQAEIERLYRRRAEWEVDADALLAEAVKESRFASHPDLSYVHGFIRPVVADRRIWSRAVGAVGGVNELEQELRLAADGAYGRNPLPTGIAPNWRRRGADERLFSTLPDATASGQLGDAQRALDLRINVDGRGHLFFGRAGARANGGMIVIFEPEIASAVAAFISVLGRLYRLGGYQGQVDLGICLTNVRDGVTLQRVDARLTSERDAYLADAYPRTARLSAAGLEGGRKVALGLLLDFFEAMTGASDFDPFAV